MHHDLTLEVANQIVSERLSEWDHFEGEWEYGLKTLEKISSRPRKNFCKRMSDWVGDPYDLIPKLRWLDEYGIEYHLKSHHNHEGCAIFVEGSRNEGIKRTRKRISRAQKEYERKAKESFVPLRKPSLLKKS